MNERRRSHRSGPQPMQLLYCPPSYGSFSSADLVRFRLLLNHQGWCLGLVWHAYERPGQPAKAGITWNTSSKVKDSIWSYLSQSAAGGLDAGNAFEAVVADTRDAYWADEFVLFGSEFDLARRWMQSFTDDEAWARGRELPPRTSHFTWPDPEQFRFFAAYSLEGEARGFMATGAEVLLREEGEWWRVPGADRSLVPARLVPVRAEFREVFDVLGLECLQKQALVAAFLP